MLKVEDVAIDDLSEDPKNVNRHTERDIQLLADALKRFGQQKPIVVGKDNVIVAGNGTLRAAKILGWERLAVVRTDLEGHEAIAFAIADNKTARNSEFDFLELATVLKEFQTEEIDFEGLGFVDFEIGPLLEHQWEPPDVDESYDPSTEPEKPPQEDEEGVGSRDENPVDPQLTIVLEVEHVQVVRDAIEIARSDLSISDSAALAKICDEFLRETRDVQGS